MDWSPAFRLLRFGAASLLGTAAHYLVMVAIVEGGIARPTLATAVGFLVGALVNYRYARRWAFPESQAPHGEALTKFLIIAGSGWFLNTLIVYLLTETAGVPYLLAQVAATALLFFWHYSANHLWTFGK